MTFSVIAVRVNVLDALDQMDELKDSTELKTKLLFSVMVVCMICVVVFQIGNQHRTVHTLILILLSSSGRNFVSL